MLVRNNRLSELTPREARYACTLFEEFSPRELNQLLEQFPSGWRRLLTRCLREYETFCDLASYDEYVGLLRRAPQESFQPQLGLDAAVVLGRDGTTTASRRLWSSLDTKALLTSVEQARLFWRWEFTSHVVARWFLLRHEHWKDLLPVVLNSNDELRRALLPTSNGDNGSRVRTSIRIHALVVASLIDASLTRLIPFSLIDKLNTEIFAYSFGDPRVPPLSPGWEQVKALIPEKFDAYLRRILTSNLRLFFTHVDGAPDRLAFWEEYLPSLRGALCILRDSDFASVRSSLASSADPSIQNALAQARRARRGTPAFCLFFDDLVVVEFSAMGNAASIYTRAEFEQRFGDFVLAGTSDTTDLKRPTEDRGWRILHRGDWQARARQQLWECQKASRLAPRH
jgi:hypothetical protein